MAELPTLPYAYDALEPVISEQIMKLHHQKHHQAYVDKLNAALEQAPNLADKSVEWLVKHLDEVPESIRPAVRNQGGGHLNHSFFWQCMTPGGSVLEDGALKSDLEAKYGSLDEFYEQFTTNATALFGSGWCWLMPDLSTVTTSNQDNPLTETGTMPILGLDVWEHAYYLDYLNKRDEYISKWWQVVDWAAAATRYKG